MHVRLTPSAERDLDEIEAYIATDNPVAAIDTVLRVGHSENAIHRRLSHQRQGHPSAACVARRENVAETAMTAWTIPP